MKTDRNDSAVIEVYDGISTGEKLLARVSVRNGTLPQSVTTSRENLYIKFFAEPRTSMIAFLRLTSGYSKFITTMYYVMSLALVPFSDEEFDLVFKREITKLS
jgi:hypothetical protein